MFIGRESELAYLEECYTSRKAELIVMYGRRRIGKSETLKRFSSDKNHIFYSCTKTTDSIQKQRFSEIVLSFSEHKPKYLKPFEDWISLFSYLEEITDEKEKLLLIIDEFPYMCENNPEIPSIIQNLWDSILKNLNIMLVLCGSSTSFMEKEILSEKSPLYGRATGTIHMKEMNFYDSSRFFPEYSTEDRFLAYSILGGIPHYLSQFNPEVSLEENIRKMVLMKNSPLYNEVEFLLHEELRETSTYNAILTAVALGNTKLNDISQKSLIDDTQKTNIYLRNLIELGLVEKEFNVNSKLKEKASSRGGSYRIKDRFFRFWYRYVFPYLSLLEEGREDEVYRFIVKPDLDEFASTVFEDVSQQFLIRISAVEGALPFFPAKIGRWRGKTLLRSSNGEKRTDETEIDVLAADLTNSRFIAAECKYKKTPFIYGEFEELETKMQGISKEKETWYFLFSRSGFDEKLRRMTKERKDLRLYTLEDIAEDPLEIQV